MPHVNLSIAQKPKKAKKIIIALTKTIKHSLANELILFNRKPTTCKIINFSNTNYSIDNTVFLILLIARK